MKALAHRVLALLLGSLLALLSTTAFAGPFSSLVVFGESLSDSGNNAFVFDNVLGPPLPAGSLRTPVPIPSQDFIPDFPYASGRYSNGPVWAERLASRLGVTASPSMAGGSDFAFAGARSGPAGSAFPYSLQDQARMFLERTAGKAPSDALYALQVGGNDVRDAFAALVAGKDPASLLSSSIRNIDTVFLQLAAAGAEHFLVLNVPDLGKAPAVTALGPSASAAASGIAAGFNGALESSLAQLAASEASDLRLLDLFDLQTDIFSNPSFYGFNDLASACAFSLACVENPSAAFFWDGVHPTASVHAIVAEAALGLIPLPNTSLLLAIGLPVLVFARRVARLLPEEAK
jgi:phospholipase/lecithinase/hemolysin